MVSQDKDTEVFTAQLTKLIEVFSPTKAEASQTYYLSFDMALLIYYTLLYVRDEAQADFLQTFHITPQE